MNKKTVLILGVALAAGAVWARPHHGGGPHGGPRGPMVHHVGPRMPMHRPPPHFRHHGGWGHSGRYFWPGFVGGVIGGVVADALVAPTVITTPTVVTTPVVAAPVVAPTVYSAQPVCTTQQVWVPGAYVDQVQPNGTVVRIWQPGHYETRSVITQ